MKILIFFNWLYNKVNYFVVVGYITGSKWCTSLCKNDYTNFLYMYVFPQHNQHVACCLSMSQTGVGDTDRDWWYLFIPWRDLNVYNLAFSLKYIAIDICRHNTDIPFWYARWLLSVTIILPPLSLIPLISVSVYC